MTGALVDRYDEQPSDPHERDHARLDAAWDAWDRLGRPAGQVRDARKRLARRRLGLRLQAHAVVHHGTQLGIGWSYADVYERHAKGEALR